jgi:hypothetical protein
METKITARSFSAVLSVAEFCPSTFHYVIKLIKSKLARCNLALLMGILRIVVYFIGLFGDRSIGYDQTATMDSIRLAASLTRYKTNRIRPLVKPEKQTVRDPF